MSIEPALIKHCSPTLASLKVGSLFSFHPACWKCLSEEANAINRELEKKGLALRIIRADDARALCYLYRKGQLNRLLEDADVQAFLAACGYERFDMETVLNRLCDRLIIKPDFPHEVGLFLGYPLSDVKAFIENNGQNCLYCGPWKVYTNACEALRQFAKFKKCADVYCRLYHGGQRSLHQLTVAA